MSRRSSEGGYIEDVLTTVVFVAGGLFVLVAIIGWPVYVWACYHHVQHITCSVVDKDRTTNTSGSSDARIYTSDCGNFVVQDATFRKNFHSSDTYRQINKGETYRFTTIGYRIPFLSEFPNIVEAKAVR